LQPDSQCVPHRLLEVLARGVKQQPLPFAGSGGPVLIQ